MFRFRSDFKMPEFDINKKQLDKETALRAAQIRRHLRTVFDGAGIPQYSQDPNLSDPPISGGLGGLIPQPLTSHPIIKKGFKLSRP